ncbi:MAG: metal ABC transporter permease [Pseudomonadota bacterium]
MDDFLIRAALGAIGVAIAAAPLGCLVVWRRMAYFGDATAHAAVLGVALAFALDVPIVAGVLVVALVAAITVTSLAGRFHAEDTLLGVLAHGALALGLVAVAVQRGGQIDLEAFLLGDILAVGPDDLIVIWSGAVLVLMLLAWRWSAILTVTLNPDLAAAAGLTPKREELVQTVALAVVVAVAIKVVGALLIGALMLIPAATVRPFARTPEAMALLASVTGVGAAISGLAVSWHWDTPAGPSIVTMALAAFAASALISLVWGRAAR